MPELKTLTNDEFNTLKSAMYGEFGKLTKEVGPGDQQKPVEAVYFLEFEDSHFKGEVAVVGGDHLFHFYPVGPSFPQGFKDLLAGSFLKVYKNADRLCWDFVSDLPLAGHESPVQSWVVRAIGFANSPFADSLPRRLKDTLHNALLDGEIIGE